MGLDSLVYQRSPTGSRATRVYKIQRLLAPVLLGSRRTLTSNMCAKIPTQRPTSCFATPQVLRKLVSNAADADATSADAAAALALLEVAGSGEAPSPIKAYPQACNDGELSIIEHSPLQIVGTSHPMAHDGANLDNAEGSASLEQDIGTGQPAASSAINDEKNTIAAPTG